MWQSLREFPVAEEHFLQGIELRCGGRSGLEHTNLLNALLSQGKRAAADSIYQVILAAGAPAQVRTARNFLQYERYVTTPNPGRTAIDAFRLAEAYLRLGELYESRGEARKAIGRLEDFIEPWKNADPDRRSVVAEVRASIQRLRARTG